MKKETVGERLLQLLDQIGQLLFPPQPQPVRVRVDRRPRRK